MSRYIDADVMRDEWLYESGTFEPNDVLDSIDCQPTVDAVPVVHGHWEIVPNDDNRDDHYKMRCSACGETLWSIQSEELYCCKCGSKMDDYDDGERKDDGE